MSKQPADDAAVEYCVVRPSSLLVAGCSLVVVVDFVRSLEFYSLSQKRYSTRQYHGLGQRIWIAKVVLTGSEHSRCDCSR